MKLSKSHVSGDLPANLDAERSVLGAILLDNAAYGPAVEILRPGDFSHDANRRIFARMVSLGESGRPIDPVTLAEELLRTAELEAVGGVAYLAALTEGLPRASNVAHYARIVKERSIRRHIMRQAKSLFDGAADIGTELDTLIERGEQGQQILSAALRKEVAAESIFRSAKQLAETTPEQVEWVLTGYVACGATTEVAAKVKLGKTTLILHACRAMLDSTPFLGFRTREVPAILYLTEQPDASFREALEAADLLGRENFVFTSWHSARALSWPKVVAAAVAEAKRIGAPLIVVDTLPQWAGIVDENSSAEALAAMRPLQEAAGVHGLAVVIVRHDRKSGGEVGDSRRGSSAFAGAVDIVLSLRKPDGNSNGNIRLIHALSRFRETTSRLAIELRPEGYVSLGTESALAVRQATEAILEVAPVGEGAALTGNELFALAKVKRTSGQEALNDLLRDGQLKRAGCGKKGDAFRYFVTEEIDSAGTSSYRAAERIPSEADAAPKGQGHIGGVPSSPGSDAPGEESWEL